MALFGKKNDESSQLEGMPPDMGMPPEQGYDDPGYPADYGQDPNQYPPQGYAPEQYPQQGMEQPAPPPAPEINKEEIQEIAEAIVEEKWNEKRRDIDKVLEWKEEVTAKLAQLQQQMDDMKGSFDSLHKGILGKISEYDENLTNVGTEIKAMEKVFSKVLPSFTDSVNKLQRISNSRVVVKK